MDAIAYSFFYLLGISICYALVLIIINRKTLIEEVDFLKDLAKKEEELKAKIDKGEISCSIDNEECLSCGS